MPSVIDNNPEEQAPVGGNNLKEIIVAGVFILLAIILVWLLFFRDKKSTLNTETVFNDNGTDLWCHYFNINNGEKHCVVDESSRLIFKGNNLDENNSYFSLTGKPLTAVDIEEIHAATNKDKGNNAYKLLSEKYNKGGYLYLFDIKVKQADLKYGPNDEWKCIGDNLQTSSREFVNQVDYAFKYEDQLWHTKNIVTITAEDNKSQSEAGCNLGKQVSLSSYLGLMNSYYNVGTKIRIVTDGSTSIDSNSRYPLTEAGLKRWENDWAWYRNQVNRWNNLTNEEKIITKKPYSPPNDFITEFINKLKMIKDKNTNLDFCFYLIDGNADGDLKESINKAYSTYLCKNLI